MYHPGGTFVSSVMAAAPESDAVEHRACNCGGAGCNLHPGRACNNPSTIKSGRSCFACRRRSERSRVTWHAMAKNRQVLPPPMPCGVQVVKRNVHELWGGGGAGGAGEAHVSLPDGPPAPVDPVHDSAQVCIDMTPHDGRPSRVLLHADGKCAHCVARPGVFVFELRVHGARAGIVPDAFKVLVDPPRPGSHYTRPDVFAASESASAVNVRVLGPRAVSSEVQLEVHYHAVVVSCEPWSLEFFNLGCYRRPPRWGASTARWGRSLRATRCRMAVEKQQQDRARAHSRFP